MEENYFTDNYKPRPSISVSRKGSFDDLPFIYQSKRNSFGNNELFKALVSNVQRQKLRQSNCETLIDQTIKCFRGFAFDPRTKYL